MRLNFNYSSAIGFKWKGEYENDNFLDQSKFPELNEIERYVLIQLPMMYGYKFPYNTSIYKKCKLISESILIKLITRCITKNYSDKELTWNDRYVYLTRSLRLFQLKHFDKNGLYKAIKLLDIPVQDINYIVSLLKLIKVWNQNTCDIIVYEGINHKKYKELLYRIKRFSLLNLGQKKFADLSEARNFNT